MARPRETHFDTIPCLQANCTHYAEGWKTKVSTGSAQDNYIRRESGRSFKVLSVAGGETTFKFAAEQRCFRQHWEPRDLMEHYGHRNRPGAPVTIHENPEDWLEHSSQEAYKLQKLMGSG